MPKPAQLPVMIELLDDESIREDILAQLYSFGDVLDLEMKDQNIPPAKIKEIVDLVQEYQISRNRIKNETLFKPGQLVKHRRYGYRGVIVHVDECCKADEDWYKSNKSQPDRNQPWYYVLVHGTVQVTYAAQSSLWYDPDPQEVNHPILHKFFTDFKNGRYERNHIPWPE